MSNTYGSSQYGLNTYGLTDDISSEVLERYFIDLMKYVPPHVYINSPIVQKTYEGQGNELGKLLYYVTDLLNQFFIDTATWGLIYWEEEFGIKTNLNYSYEERREVVKAKKRGNGTCTVALIKNVAEAFSGGEVQVIEHNTEYYFEVKFVGVKGIPKNMDAFIEMLNLIKPAHLDYVFTYTYLTWDQFDAYNFTADQLDNIAWDELEVM